jgi:CHASE3 domain sensor protein
MDSVPLAVRVATRAPRTRFQERITREAVRKPEMNRQERIILTAYVVMAVLIVAFLAAMGIAWSLG